MKVFIATYFIGGVDHNVGDKRLRLHSANCRYLNPTYIRPSVGSRRATPSEIAKHPACKVCP